MLITLIACSDKNGIIGKNNSLPIKNSTDMNFFKNYTTNKNILMGRKTFESLGSKELPNRNNFILSKTLQGENVFSSKEEFLSFFEKNFLDQELIIIGGSELYKMFLPQANKILLNEVDEEIEFSDQDTIVKFPLFERNNFYHSMTYSENGVSFNKYFRIKEDEVFVEETVEKEIVLETKKPFVKNKRGGK